MKTVWKYDLDATQLSTVVDVPQGGVVVHVAPQARVDEDGMLRDALCVWVQVDTDAPPTAREFFVVGTGEPIPDGGTHRGTSFKWGDELVWHVYEVTG